MAEIMYFKEFYSWGKGRGLDQKAQMKKLKCYMEGKGEGQNSCEESGAEGACLWAPTICR